MSAVEFEPWPKIARLNRDIIITEKIDGTNAAVVIDQFDADEREWSFAPEAPGNETLVAGTFDGKSRVVTQVRAQSRTRFITPGDDNFGFAKWVDENFLALIATLGPGRHFGEWWGSGIQRGYGLSKGHKRFSLFNSSRWSDEELATSGVAGLGVVPELYRGPFSQVMIQAHVDDLREHGSIAAPGFMRPEGVIVWHTAERTSFKVTLEGDEAPKSMAA